MTRRLSARTVVVSGGVVIAVVALGWFAFARFRYWRAVQSCDTTAAHCVALREHLYDRAVDGCREAVERQSRFRVNWLKGESELQASGWVSSTPGGAIRLYGDAVELQNGFGAWERMTYACDWDPIEQRVFRATLTSGRFAVGLDG